MKWQMAGLDTGSVLILVANRGAIRFGERPPSSRVSFHAASAERSLT